MADEDGGCERIVLGGRAESLRLLDRAVRGSSGPHVVATRSSLVRPVFVLKPRGAEDHGLAPLD
jgi:hypothetical protein